ncbi:SRPBCC family protein [Citricoccus sp. GCM10030269]|uniref:SRPBCC family protein n=1 Tax=Citricoccus sp. GCM10030269 TaxID=3273388 RepID=UPI00360F9748
MNETAHGEKQQTVTRTIEAPSKDIFQILTLPARHHEFDGSGMVRSDEKSQRIQQVGDVFTMNMQSSNGEYQMENHVVAYDENKLVGWKPAPLGTEPPGWQWVYRLEPVDQDTTEVSLTYDWSEVTDQNLLEKNIFPAISSEQMDESLARLQSLV